jgi:uncharacterized membrane protein
VKKAPLSDSKSCEDGARNDRVVGQGEEVQVARIEKIIEIHASADAAYQVWRRLDRFPLFSDLLERVEVTDEGLSRWTVRGPFRRRIRWLATVIEDAPGRYLRWQSIGGMVPLHGRVDFIPANGGCVARFMLDYKAPFGWVGQFITDFVWDLDLRLEQDLDRLKSFIERPLLLPVRRLAEVEEKSAAEPVAARS